MLEELLASEVLEIGVIDPSPAHLLVGQRKDVLEQRTPASHSLAIDVGYLEKNRLSIRAVSQILSAVAFVQHAAELVSVRHLGYFAVVTD